MITTTLSTPLNYDLPMHGAHNPSTHAQGTTPGSFARRADIGGPLAFSSPDTPGMPAPSNKTAWDFLPIGWSTVELAEALRAPLSVNVLLAATFDEGIATVGRVDNE